MVLTRITTGVIEDGTITSTDMAVDPRNASNLNSGDVPTAQLGNVPPVDVSPLDNDLAVLAFKTQANGNLTRYSLVDQVVDSYQDATGINTGASTGETRDAANMYYSGMYAPNYYGDASDGTLSTTADVTYTVANKSGSYDGDMVVKQYQSLTIGAGHTVTTDQPCRGMLIYVGGNCIINGTLSMTAKGAMADPTASGGSDSNAVGASGLQLGLVTPSGGTSFTNDGTGFNGAGSAAKTAIANQSNLLSNGTVFTISQLGALGDTGATGPNPGAGEMTRTSGAQGASGTTGGITLSSGGGGSGATWQHAGYSQGTGGPGGRGGAFSGGAGGGGAVSGGGPVVTGGTGGNYGGAGGDGKATNSLPNYNYGSGGGAGNPGGGGAKFPGAPGATPTVPTGGVGGIIWLIVKGTLTIGAAGSVQAKGSDGQYTGQPRPGVPTFASRGADGGSSGGGAIFALSAGAFANSGEISAAGGLGPLADPGPAPSGQTSHTTSNGYGGKGGNGGVHSGELLSDETINNMTLISNGVTASVQPDSADLVVMYSNGLAGTAVPNTDLVASVSRDGGTSYTTATLVDKGSTGGQTVLTANGIDISGQPAGTSMVYKIVTTAQTSTKTTRIHGVSIGWA